MAELTNKETTVKTLKITFLFSLLTVFALPTVANTSNTLPSGTKLALHGGYYDSDHRVTHNSPWRPSFKFKKTHTYTKCMGLMDQHCKVMKRTTVHRAHRTVLFR